MQRTLRAFSITALVALGFTGQAFAAGAVISKPALQGASMKVSTSKTKYPRTPIGTAAVTTVERHLNASALIQGKPKTYAGADDDKANKGDDTAYDLKLKLQTRKPKQ